MWRRPHPRDDAAGQQHGAVNLSQGFPDFPAPEPSRRPPRRDPRDVNQYAITWGAQAAARRDRATIDAARHGHRRRPDTQVTVCCGSTEAMMADPARDRRSRRRGDRLRAVLRELRPGRDPVRRHAALRPAARSRTGRSIPTSCGAFSNKTRAIIVNTPNNPTGKVFTRDELETHRRAVPAVGRARDHRRDLRAHPLRRRRARADGHARRHGRADGDDQRLSKTFSVTGWRVGWAVAPPDLDAGASARCTTS